MFSLTFLALRPGAVGIGSHAEELLAQCSERAAYAEAEDSGPSDKWRRALTSEPVAQVNSNQKDVSWMFLSLLHSQSF